MNPNIIREKMLPHKGERVLVKIKGMRGKTEKYIGTIKEFYPKIFTVEAENSIKCFNYAELEGGEVIITFI